MQAFDGQNEVSRRKAEAKAAGDAYMQLADFRRPRRRFFLGAWLAKLVKIGSGKGQLPTVMPDQKKADQLSA